MVANYPSKTINFSKALDALKVGKRVRRLSWDKNGNWIELQSPNKTNPMTRPFLFIATITRDRAPWIPTQDDLLASDWTVLEN